MSGNIATGASLEQNINDRLNLEFINSIMILKILVYQKVVEFKQFLDNRKSEYYAYRALSRAFKQKFEIKGKKLIYLELGN